MKELETVNPSANAVLPDHYNPFIHERMLAAARLDTTIIRESTTGSRVRGTMPHTDFYEVEQKATVQQHCEEEFQLAQKQRDAKL